MLSPVYCEILIESFDQEDVEQAWRKVLYQEHSSSAKPFQMKRKRYGVESHSVIQPIPLALQNKQAHFIPPGQAASESRELQSLWLDPILS